MSNTLSTILRALANTMVEARLRRWDAVPAGPARRPSPSRWADQEDDSRLTDSTCSATPGRPAMIAANATAETDVSKLSAAASSARCTPAGRLTLTRDRSVTLWLLSFSAASSTFPPLLAGGGHRLACQTEPHWKPF